MPLIDTNELRQRRPTAKPVVETVATDSWKKAVQRCVLGAHEWVRTVLIARLWRAYLMLRDRMVLGRAPPPPPRFGLRCVLVSDTHGCHRQLTIPDGDVLIHAGDFTRMGHEEDAVDFNAWLGELPHAHKIVINGNHEYNAAWKGRAAEMVSNATFLKDAAVVLPGGCRVHGTDFAWPMKSRNPNYEAVGAADVLVCHSPVDGYADGGKGCAELLRLAKRLRPRLVVSGHIHFAHARVEGRGTQLRGTCFVNAANAGKSHTQMAWEPVVVDI